MDGKDKAAVCKGLYAALDVENLPKEARDILCGLLAEFGCLPHGSCKTPV